MMTLLNKGQTIFIYLCMVALWLLAANFLAYYLNGIPLKEIITEWDFFKLIEILKEDYVPASIKAQGYKALFMGFGLSLLLPLSALALVNKNPKQSLHGDAKFASQADILKSTSVTLGDAESRGIIVGKFKGKLIRYTKPDFVSLGAGTRAGKVFSQ